MNPENELQLKEAMRRLVMHQPQVPERLEKVVARAAQHRRRRRLVGASITSVAAITVGVLLIASYLLTEDPVVAISDPAPVAAGSGEARSWQTIPDPPLASSAGRVFETPHGLLLLATAEGTQSNVKAAVWTPAGDSWQKFPASPLSWRYGAVTAAADTLVLVWGGAGGAGLYRDGSVLNLATRTWTLMPDSPLTARRDAASVWTGGELLVWGGNNGAGPLRDGAAYNPVTNSWRRLRDAPAALSATPLGQRLGDEALFIGACLDDPGRPCRQTESLRYLTATDTWQAVEPPPVSGGALVGGVDSAFVWDGSKAQLTSLNAPPKAGWGVPSSAPLSRRTEAGVAFGQSQVVVVGGLASDSGSPVVSGAAFSTMTGRWRTLPDLTVPMQRPNAVIMGDRLVVMDTCCADIKPGLWLPLSP